MNKLLLTFFVPLLLLACEQVEEAGDKAAREITGGNMIQQGHHVQQQLQVIEKQQQQNLKQLEE